MTIQPTDIGLVAEHILMSTVGDGELIADRVALIDPTSSQDLGVDFSGIWRSHSLNREDKMNIYTLSLLTLAYTAADATTIAVRFSGDGGATWSADTVVDLLATTGSRMNTVTLSPVITGDDLRFEIEMDQPESVLILKWRPRLIKRGAVRYG